MPDPALVVRTPAVIHERLDDEVIAIDLERGIYYAMVGPAADIWTSFTTAATADAVAAALATRYRLDAGAIREEVHSFVARLQDERLLVATDADDAAVGATIDGAPGGPWAPPELEAYDDMADLVLLDPIHQVDEAGWPHLPNPNP
jgi:hypothetical protein